MRRNIGQHRWQSATAARAVIMESCPAGYPMAVTCGVGVMRCMVRLHGKECDREAQSPCTALPLLWHCRALIAGQVAARCTPKASVTTDLKQT